MEEFMLTDNIFEQIKDFDHEDLTEEQSLLIDKLILNEELKIRYEKNGLCKECKQPKNYDHLYQCKLQQNFKNWASGNHEVDMFIQKTQLKAENHREILEWIEYDRFENIEYLTKGGFGTIYKAIWKDGYIKSWDSENNKWTRKKTYCRDYENFPVVLKCLYNSKEITSDFLREIETHMILSKYMDIISLCFGITKDPKSGNFMIVMGYAKDANELQNLLSNLWTESYYKNQITKQIEEQIEEADKINKKLTSSSLLYDTGPTLSYTTNPKAVYTSRLLDYKNLPEPKNGEYSESLEAIDFTKLDDKSS
ncbi:uncharacterized protein OCT59_019251 [Rhizophagus irregularis]|uniref:uncharacterized protein n=1 Tax=Rhizophagus irregularis TaxID=588596 RepID=UPI00331C35B1|nr:hypothetical protein OCT59_019251 [Rhizophagus irregularis]